MLDAQKIESSFSRIADLAKKDGVAAELIVESGESLGLSVNAGRLEKFESSQSHVGGLRVILNGVEGYYWTESLEPKDLEEAYFEAVENAKFASRGRTPEQLKNEAVALYAPDKTAGLAKEDPALFNESSDKVAMEDKIDRAMKIESKTKAVDSRIATVPYNGYRESKGEIFILNTAGVRAHQRATAISGYAYCLAKQGEESRMAGDSFFSRDSLRVNENLIDSVAQGAAAKALAKLGACAPETGRYPILIDHDVVAEVFGLIADYFSGKAVFEQASLFAKQDQASGKRETEIGKKIASPLLTLIDDPSLSDGVGNRTFDSEGAPTRKTEIIGEGVLKGFLTNSIYAKKLDMPHTANAVRSAKGELGIGPSNLIVKQGTSSFEKMLAAHPKVIYVTDFTGYHAGFREGSGEFSFQSEGELWENGRRVKALCNFVVAGSIRELLANIEQVSSRMSKKNSSVIAPDLLISSLSVAGV